MTFKEKLQKEYPRAVSDKFVGGCSRCPSDYKYEKAVSFEACRTMYLTCEKCWNREIPTEDNTTKNLSEEFNTFVCDKCLIKIEDFVEVETLLDIYGVEYEDTKDYKFKYCPECGRKAVI